MIDTIVFDLGNVILPFDFEKSVKKISAYSTLNCENIRKFLFETGLKKKADKGEISKFDFFEEVNKSLNTGLKFNQFRKIWCEIFVINKKVTEIIKSLRSQGYYLILYSDTDELHYEYFRDKFDILKYFDNLIFSFEIKHVKTEKESISFLQNRLKSRPENSIFIDDKEENLLYARELGINCILFKNNELLLMELKKYGVNIHPY